MGTLHFFEVKFKSFVKYCDIQQIIIVLLITPTLLRKYLLFLEMAGHNPGGRHAHYRAFRAFLYWYKEEIALDDRKNPIKKVKAPITPYFESENAQPIPSRGAFIYPSLFAIHDSFFYITPCKLISPCPIENNPLHYKNLH